MAISCGHDSTLLLAAERVRVTHTLSASQTPTFHPHSQGRVWQCGDGKHSASRVRFTLSTDPQPPPSSSKPQLVRQAKSTQAVPGAPRQPPRLRASQSCQPRRRRRRGRSEDAGADGWVGKAQGGAAGIVQVDCGQHHYVALDTSGGVWTWGVAPAQPAALGQGGHGKLGQGPQRVRSLSHARVTQVAAGDAHTCAVTEHGQLYTWGIGVLGTVPAHDAKARMRVGTPALVRGILCVRSVAAGGRHTLAACALQQPVVVPDTAPAATPSSGDQSLFGEHYEVEYKHDRVPTLKHLCEVQLAKSLSLTNVAEYAPTPTQFCFASTHTVAPSFCRRMAYGALLPAPSLHKWCNQFVSSNMDAMLTMLPPGDAELLLDSYVALLHIVTPLSYTQLCCDVSATCKRPSVVTQPAPTLCSHCRRRPHRLDHKRPRLAH